MKAVPFAGAEAAVICRASRAGAVAVGVGVGERVGAGEVGIGGVVDAGAPAGDRGAAAGRVRGRGDLQGVQLGVGVVGQGIDRVGGRVLVHRGGIIQGVRRIVHVADVDQHRGGVG